MLTRYLQIVFCRWVDSQYAEHAKMESARVGEIGRLGDVSLPEKISGKNIRDRVKEIRQIAESRDPDRKRMAIRRYIAAMEADPENRTIRVLMQPLSSICLHSLVAPGGAEPIYTIEIAFSTKPRGYTIRQLEECNLDNRAT